MRLFLPQVVDTNTPAPVRPPRPANIQPLVKSVIEPINDEDNFLLPVVSSSIEEDVDSPPPLPPRPLNALSPSKKRQSVPDAAAHAQGQENVEKEEKTYSSSRAITDDEIMAQLLVTAQPSTITLTEEDPLILTAPKRTGGAVKSDNAVTPKSGARKALWRDTPEEDRQAGVIVHETSKPRKKERTPRKNRRKSAGGSSVVIPVARAETCALCASPTPATQNERASFSKSE